MWIPCVTVSLYNTKSSEYIEQPSNPCTIWVICHWKVARVLFFFFFTKGHKCIWIEAWRNHQSSNLSLHWKCTVAGGTLLCIWPLPGLRYLFMPSRRPKIIWSARTMTFFSSKSNCICNNSLSVVQKQAPQPKTQTPTLTLVLNTAFKFNFFSVYFLMYI